MKKDNYGKCYMFNYQYCIQNPDWQLVHGNCINPKTKQKQGHAWCEKEIIIDDKYTITLVYDAVGEYEGEIGHKKNKNIKLHQLILEINNINAKGKHIDHINQNKLDNRKENLRICKQRNNMANSNLSKANTSGYKGVYWSNKKNKWYAKIGYKNNTIHLGYFNNIQEAFKTRLEAEEIYFGEYKNVIKYNK